MAPDELGALLAAHCRHATTALPPGAPGVRWAADFLVALPAACARRLPDLITTGPKMFEFFVGHGFFAAMPSPRLVPKVLGLVARVSPLLQARSARQWALWLARVWDPGAPVLAAIARRTPAYVSGIQAPGPAGPPLRSAQLRDERDRLVADLASSAAEHGRLRTALAEAREDRDRLAAELAELVARERQTVASGAAERDRLAGELAAATERLRQAESPAVSERLARELVGVRAEHGRMSRALAAAEETARQRHSEHERMAQVLADERLVSERLRGELAALRHDLAAAGGPTESAPQAMSEIEALQASMARFQAARARFAARAAGRHPDHDRLQEAEGARRQAVAVADALRMENAELRAERDGLLARVTNPRADPGQGWSDALAEVEQRLTQVQAELAAARRDGEHMTRQLTRKRELIRGLRQAMDAQELELAAVEAELTERKSGASGPLVVTIARELAVQAVRDAQAQRPSVDDD